MTPADWHSAGVESSKSISGERHAEGYHVEKDKQGHWNDRAETVCGISSDSASIRKVVQETPGQTVLLRADYRLAGALERYQHEWPYIIDGRVPPPVESDSLRVRDLANLYLTQKRGLLMNGDLSERSFHGYLRTGEVIVKAFVCDRDRE